MQAERSLGKGLLGPSAEEVSTPSPQRARWQALTACMMLAMTASWVSAAYAVAGGAQAAASFMVAGALFLATGLSTFGVHMGAGSSYGAFIAALQHISVRLHAIGQQHLLQSLGDVDADSFIFQEQVAHA